MVQSIMEVYGMLYVQCVQGERNVFSARLLLHILAFLGLGGISYSDISLSLVRILTGIFSDCAYFLFYVTHHTLLL